MRFVVRCDGAAEVLGAFFLVLEEGEVLRDGGGGIADFEFADGGCGVRVAG